MHKPKFLIAFAIFTFLNTASARDKKYTMDELLAAHLQSIGSPEALKQIHSRVLSGTASVRFIQGATGAWDDGQFSFGSELYRIGIMIKIIKLIAGVLAVPLMFAVTRAFYGNIVLVQELSGISVDGELN